MTGYEFGSSALTVDDGWFEVWPVGEGRGRGPLKSWPTFISYLKATEYFAEAGRLRKLRKIAGMQEELERRYSLIQQEALAGCPDGLSVAVRLPPFPEGTPMSKQTIRADYTAAIGLVSSATPTSRDGALAAARESADEMAAEGVQATVSERQVLGRHATVVAASVRADGVPGTAQRIVVIPIEGQPVYAEVVLRSGFEAAVATLDSTLDAILEGAELVVSAES